MTIRLEEHLALQVNHGDLGAVKGAHSVTTDTIYFGNYAELSEYVTKEIKLAKEGSTDYPLLNYRPLVKTVAFVDGSRFGELTEKGNTYIVGKLIDKSEITKAFPSERIGGIKAFMNKYHLRGIVKLVNGNPYEVMHIRNKTAPYYFPKDALLVDIDDQSHSSSYFINDKVGTQVFDTEDNAIHIGAFYPYTYEVADNLVMRRTNYVVRMRYPTTSAKTGESATRTSMHTCPWTAKGLIYDEIKSAATHGYETPYTIEVYKKPVITLPAGLLTPEREVLSDALIPEQCYKVGQVINSGCEVLTSRGVEPIGKDTLVINHKHLESLGNPTGFKSWLSDLQLRLHSATRQNTLG